MKAISKLLPPVKEYLTPRLYGTDNRVTLDAIAGFGTNARGVAVIQPTATDAELKMLDAGGIRGIRFSLAANPTSAAVTTLEMIEPLSKRVNALGWHTRQPAIAFLLRILKNCTALRSHRDCIMTPVASAHYSSRVERPCGGNWPAVEFPKFLDALDVAVPKEPREHRGAHRGSPTSWAKIIASSVACP